MVWPVQHSNDEIAPSQGAFPGGWPQPQQSEQGGLTQLLKPQGQGGQSFLSPERINGLSQKLGNIQQVLGLVQKAAPIVQEYGPMIKNLPPLIKMMRTLNNSTDDDTASEDNDTGDVLPELEDIPSVDGVETVADTETEADTSNPAVAPKAIQTGESTPKLFI